MFGNLLLTCVLLTPGADPIVQIRAQSTWPYSTGPGTEFVVRSAAELLAASPDKPKAGPSPEGAERKIVAELAKAVKVKEIDWKTQMLVVVRLKKIHSRGIQIGRLEFKEKELTVHYLYWEPVAAREDDPNPKPTDAAIVLLVDRFDGKVKFAGDMRTPK